MDKDKLIAVGALLFLIGILYFTWPYNNYGMYYRINDLEKRIKNIEQFILEGGVNEKIY